MSANNKARGRAWEAGCPSPYQGRDLTHFPDWHNLIVWDAFFNNLTAGLMIVSTVAWLSGPSSLGHIMPLALTMALLLVIADLLILVMDLGDPWRFLHSMRVMRLTSPLSIGVWGLTSYAACLAVAVLLSWTVWFVGGGFFAGAVLVGLRNLFIVMSLVAAIVIVCYKGVVFSCTSQPGLCEARWLPPFMVTDAMLMGFGVFTLIALLTIPPQDFQLLVAPAIMLLCARCTAFALLWQDVKNRARLIYGAENRFVGWSVFVFGGILPLALLFFGFFGLALASMLVICCGLLERYWLIGLARPAERRSESK